MAKSGSIAGPLAGALLLSLGSTYVLGRRITGVKLAHVETRRYLSPRRALEPGEVLQAGDVQSVDWPAKQPVEGALSRPEQAVGRTVLYPLSPGQPVVDRDLAQPGSGPGLASRVPNGMRAIALKSDEVMGVAGFLQPGSHVDVLATYRMSQMAEPSTATVLQNAEVVAAGQQTKPDPEGKAVTTTVVTLLLSPQQAERALLASNQGVLHFVLRNSADQTIQTTEPVMLSDLTGAPRLTGTAAVTTGAKPVVVRAPRRPQTDDGGGVEIVLGGGSGTGSMRDPSRRSGLPAADQPVLLPPQPAQTATVQEQAPGLSSSSFVTGRQP